MVGYEELRDRQIVKKVVDLARAIQFSGTVVGEDGKPLKGVKVRADSTMGVDGRGYAAPDTITVETDEKGAFTFDGLPEGYTQLWPQYPNMARVEDVFKIYEVTHPKLRTSDEPIAIRMVATGTIKGKVTNLPGGKAEGVSISVAPVGGERVGKWGGGSNLKPDGSFEFTNVYPDEYVVSTKPQLPGIPKDPNAKTIKVQGGKTVEVEVKYTR
jgi:hypothetical protein